MIFIENMETTGSNIKYYKIGTTEADSIISALKEKFKKVFTFSWLSVSEISYDTIVNDDVVSVIFEAVPKYLDDLKPIFVGRKYLLNKLQIYDKVYLVINNKNNIFTLPAESNSLFEAYLVNVYGQAGDEDYSKYKDIYFSCENHQAVEFWANQKFIVGKYCNYYCATFNKDTKQLIRVKNYWYDEKSESSEWNEYLVSYYKQTGLDPLE